MHKINHINHSVKSALEFYMQKKISEKEILLNRSFFFSRKKDYRENVSD